MMFHIVLYSAPNEIQITQYACEACVCAPQINPDEVQMTRIIKNLLCDKVAKKWAFDLVSRLNLRVEGWRGRGRDTHKHHHSDLSKQPGDTKKRGGR